MSKNLVMNTFSGRYLLEQSNKNIGHENINFFKPTGCDDKWLLWFNCDGIVSKTILQDDGNINILMVTNFANEADKFRVLAFAKNCHIINGVTTPSQSNQAKKSRFDAFNNQFENVSYGNVLLRDIFANNTYQGKPDSENTLASFWTDTNSIFVPEDENITIRIKKESTADINQNMANEKMRMYIEDDDSFDKLIKRISWIGYDNLNNCLPHFPLDITKYEVEETLFTATRNEKDELTLSNIISYSLSKSPALLQKMISTLIPGANAKSAEYVIKREDKHVDLTILLPDKTIIIENKIDSTIEEYKNDKTELKEKILKAFNKEYKPPKKNPKRKDALERYQERLNQYEKITKKINEYISQINDDDKLCQLTKYYIQSKIDAELSNRASLPIYYFFLVPNYTANKFTVDNNKVFGYAFSDEYKMIKYSDLYDIFEKVTEYPYRDDILKEFKLLKSSHDNYEQNRQIYSFLKKAGI